MQNREDRVARTALLAIHYQNEVILPQGAIRQGFAEADPERAAFIARVGAALTQARAQGIEVISIRIAFAPDHSDLIANCPIFAEVRRRGALREGSHGAEFVEGLGPLPGELVVTHRRTSAFVGTDLEALLISRGILRLYVAGVATHSAVEATARHASDLGFDVTVLADISHAADPQMHAAALRSLALVTTIGDSATLLGSDQTVDIGGAGGF